MQSVDKRHHPTESLINCEMYSYLPLSYSRAPKTPPLPASSASPLLPVCKEKKQTGLHKDSFWEKKENCSPSKFPVSRFFHSFPIISTHTHTYRLVYTCIHTETSVNTLCLNTGMQGHRDKRSRHNCATGLCFKVVQLHFVLHTVSFMIYLGWLFDFNLYLHIEPFPNSCIPELVLISTDCS